MASRRKGKGSTIEQAAKHYEDAIPRMKTNQVSGVSHFLGRDASGSAPVRHYQEKIVSGLSSKWKERTNAAYS